MKMKRILSLVPAAILFAASAVFAQSGTVTKSITITSDPHGGVVVSTNGAAAAVSISTNGTTTVISVTSDPIVITSHGSSANTDDIMRQVEEAMRQAMGNAGAQGAVKDALDKARQQMQSALSGGGSHGAVHVGPGGKGSARAFGGGGLLGAPNPEPAIITTAPLDAAVRAEWQEDLKVMDKLLRDEINRVDGDSPRHAMGIRVFLSNRSAEQPMYLDGCGAVFSYDTDIALAASGKKTEPKQEKKTTSAWDNAKRQVTSSSYSNDNVQVWVHSSQSGFSNLDKQPREFDAAKLDELSEAVIGMLVEARNIRHLKTGESVIVTISGSNDAGEPARFTFKARKEDIDLFAGGKINLEEFKKKVARKVG